MLIADDEGKIKIFIFPKCDHVIGDYFEEF